MQSNPPAKHLRLVFAHDSDVEKPIPAGVSQLLRAVLDAKLTPTLTVEQACHLDIPYLEDGFPSMEQFLADFNALRSAGLDISPEREDAPAAVILHDAKMFQAKFPELAAAIPVMLSSGGVQPYTHGVPRKTRMLRPV